MNTSFISGLEYANELHNANVSIDYVGKVKDAIKEIDDSINYHNYHKTNYSTFKGYVAEKWHAGTFNADAIASGSMDRAKTLDVNGKYSVDIQLDSGDRYSSKVYADGRKSAVQQYSYNSETGKSGYHGQKRLIAFDQKDDANNKLENMYRSIDGRTKEGRAIKETKNNVETVIRNDEGVSSIAKDKSDFENMAKDANNEGFKAEDYGASANEIINQRYVLKQSLKTGLTSAAVAVAIKITPEIINAIEYLIKTGMIDPKDIVTMGADAFKSGAEGFLQGFITSNIIINIEKGLFGTSLQAFNPTIVGMMVTIIYGTLKDSILVARDEMDKRQLGNRFVDSVAIASSYLIGTKIGGAIGGAIGQIIGFELPVVGYLLGTLIGCSLSVLYNEGKKQVISFCVDTGFTCFGLVEQDYTLPDEVIKEIGIDVFEYDKFDYSQFEFDRFEYNRFVTDRFVPDRIDLIFLRRGVIGVNKVGYC